MPTDARTRNITVDVYRGIGIALVVLGHTTGLPEDWHRAVYTFHMPAFFILSGYMFNYDKAAQTPKAQLNTRFKRLILPAWAWAALCGLPFAALCILGKLPPAELADRAIGAFTGASKVSENFNSTPIWFLFALFFVDALAIALARILTRPVWLAGLIALGGAGLLASLHIGAGPLHLATSVTALFFFGAGALLRGWSLPDRHLAWTLPCAVMLVVVNMLYNPHQVAMANNSMASNLLGLPLATLAALAGSLLIYAISRVAQLPYLAWLGQRTIPILAFNYYANSAVTAVVGQNMWLGSFCLQMALLSIVAYLSGFAPTLLGAPRSTQLLPAFLSQPRKSPR